jgi:LAO/AO transport system ATPase
VGTQKAKERNRSLDRRSISQTITLIENREPAAFKKLAHLFSSESLRRSVCFTGPGGVGKSTLISNLIPIVSQEASLCWLACDPWSPVSGGSLLGDRVRLSGSEPADHIFVRSLSTRSTQAFSRSIRDIEIYMESLFDEVWVETAGSGQTQTEIASISALSILVLQPEIGDEVQWMKSGLKELVDFYVIHKADLGGADSMSRSLLELGAQPEQIFICSSKNQTGLKPLWEAIKSWRVSAECKGKLKKLQGDLSLALYRELLLKGVDKKFKKEGGAWLKNPYTALIKKIQ